MKSRYLLLVEDNPGDARLVAALLDDDALGLGLPELRWVQTVRAAQDLLTAEPDCMAVLLDLNLPDSDGLAALHALTDTEQITPIIILTGGDSGAMGLDAMSSGAQDFLVKGQFNAETLQRAIAFAAQRKRAERALVARALTDELTGLPRRALLLDRIHAATRLMRREGGSGALLFIDLDGFKAVNDSAGHAAGDHVLRVIAQRLQQAMRASDTVARLGGDEFVVLLPYLTRAYDAAAVGAKLLASIEQDIAFDVRVLSVSASIGVAAFDGSCDSPEQLLRQADQAMYQAKREGKRRLVGLS